MDYHRINMTDLVIGKPLPWDVSDVAGHLLLSKGHIVERTQQIEALMERGLFVDSKALGREGTDFRPAPKLQELPSVLRLVNLANKRLGRLLLNVHAEEGAQEKFLEVAKAVVYATSLNPDVALACILMNQTAGSYSVRHSVDTASLCVVVARAMKKSAEEILSLAAAALTMNIGMLRLQDQMQAKQDALSDAEKLNIRNHTLDGVNILERAGIDDKNWLSCVLMHHENEDGSGYPHGKSGQEIPENAKIVSIADRYCARISDREYRKSQLPNAALRDILIADKTTIDPVLATCFVRELGIYPPGTFVRLENGEIGVVTGRGRTTTTPYVHALIGPRGAPLGFPIKRETAKQLYAIRESLDEKHAAVRVSMQQLWGSEASL